LAKSSNQPNVSHKFEKEKRGKKRKIIIGGNVANFFGEIW
jgi:hypothetical protein